LYLTVALFYVELAAGENNALLAEINRANIVYFFIDE